MQEAPPLQEDGEPARGTLALLVDRNFGPYFAAAMSSAIGVWVYNIVAAVLVFQLTGSALMVGLVNVAQFLPQVVLGPAAGARADRGDRVRQLVVGRITTACGAAGLALWVGMAGVDGLPGAAPVIACSLVVGIGFAITSAAMHAILPALVRHSELSTVVALNQAPHTLARAVGPALGTLVLALAGPAPAFALAAGATLLHALAARRVRLRPVERVADTDLSVRAGLRYLRADRSAALLLLGVAAVGLGMDPVLTLTPPLAARLGGAEAEVGWLVSAFGAGSGVVVLLAGKMRRLLGVRRMNPIGMVVFAGAYGALAFASTLAWALLAMALAGMGMMLAITSYTTQLQARLPEDLRGRVMGLWAAAYLGSRPLGALVNGAVADFVSVGAAFAGTGVVLLVGAAVARPGRVSAEASSRTSAAP